MFYQSLLFCFFLLISCVSSTISSGFYSHISKIFGDEIAEDLARKELGEKGSFGGTEGAEFVKQSKIPIVFVHGQTRRAGDLNYILQPFFDHDYTYNDVFGTTYGTRITISNYRGDRVHCDYIKQIRRMIEAVLSYTQHEQVDVIAFSMGGGMSRKAILGGQCVDTKEDLGAPLTSRIRNYISVAGVQHGTNHCDIGRSVAPICNDNNGLYCDSDYNNDINGVSGYEATGRIVAIDTSSDDILGATNSCDKVPSRFAGATHVYTLHGLDHRAAIWFLGEMVYNISQELPLKDLNEISETAILDSKRLSDEDIGIAD